MEGRRNREKNCLFGDLSAEDDDAKPSSSSRFEKKKSRAALGLQSRSRVVGK